MNKQRKTSHILNVFQYDADGHVVLPASLTLGIVPGAGDNNSKVPTTAWVRTYVTGLTYLTGNQSITVSGDATGSGTTSINLTLANTAVTPGTYGSATLVPVVTVDSKGRITSVTTAAISGSLAFTGDVTGTGTTGTSTSLTLANSGVTAGTYTKVTVDSKGRVTVGASATTTDIAEGTRLYYTDARVLAYLGANNYATQSYVTTQINNLVAGAPGLLDTLDELAAALGDDANFATTTATSLGNRLRIDTASQGLNSTQQANGRTNLGLGTAALSATGDFVAFRTFGTAANNNTGDFATAAQGTKADTAHGWGNHASAGYLTSATAATTYLTQSTAASTYLTSTNAASTYLSQTSAGNTYLTLTNAASTYLSQSNAASTYLTITNASNTYLSQSSASSIYLSIGNAATTYLSQSNASLSYVSLSGSYANPSWITSLAYSKLTGVPAFLTSYTETSTLANVTARGATTSTAVTFSGGASISNLLINGASAVAESSLALGAMGTAEGGQLTLNKATSYTFAAHIDVWNDSLRFLYGTNTATSGVAMSVNLSNRQLILPLYTASNSFTGTAAGVLAFDSSGNIITIAVPGGAVSSVSAGTGISVNATIGAITVTNTGTLTVTGTANQVLVNGGTAAANGNITLSLPQSIHTSATPTFDQVITSNNGNGTNFRIGDDAWIGDINVANTFRVQGLQDATQGYIVFGNSNATALGRSGTGALTYGGNTIYHAGNLTNLNQLTNGPGYITGYTETDTLASVTGRGASTSTAISINNNIVITSGRLIVRTGGVNTYGVVSGYDNNNHMMTFRASVTGDTSSPTFAAVHQTTLIEFAEANDTTGWFFKSASTGTYQEIARITRTGINWSGNVVLHAGNYSSYNSYSTLTLSSTLNLPNAALISVNSEPDVWGARFRTTASTTNLGAALKNIIWTGGGTTEGFAITGSGTGGAAFEVRNDGIVWARSQMRAPIFYDSDNTGYYLDPAGFSNLRVVGTDARTIFGASVGGPSSNFGGGRIYLRIHPVSSGARIMSFKLTISSTWNWAAAFGCISADVSFYFDGTNIAYPTVNITSATGMALSTLTIGSLVVENGFVSVGIFSANTNPIFASIDGFPSFDWNAVSWGSWESVGFPGAAVVNVPGSMTIGGGLTVGGSSVVTNNGGTWGISITGNAGSVGGRTVGTSTGNIAFLDNSRNLVINNPETYSGEVRLGAAWNRGGVYTSGTLSLSTGSSTIDMVYSDATRFRYYYDSNGSRLMVNTTSTPYTLIDGEARPVVYVRGRYPVLTLDHTVTSNNLHGPTIQFTFDGLSSRQWVIGTAGNGSQMDFGMSNAAYGNSNYNPHNGIGGYQGKTLMRMTETGVLIGDCGTYPTNNTPSFALQVNGAISCNDIVRTSNFRLAGTLVLSGSGAEIGNSTGARLSESYGALWNFSNSATWHHQIINGSHLCGFQSGGGNFGNGNYYGTGDVTAYYSDERLKTKINTITDAIEKIKSLEGFVYVENDLARSLGYSNEKEQAGVSAQQIQAVLPQAVSLAPFDMQGVAETGEVVSKSGENYLTVKYDRIVPLLIEGIKEQQKQIEQLKNKLDLLTQTK